MALDSIVVGVHIPCSRRLSCSIYVRQLSGEMTCGKCFNDVIVLCLCVRKVGGERRGRRDVDVVPVRCIGPFGRACTSNSSENLRFQR